MSTPDQPLDTLPNDELEAKVRRGLVSTGIPNRDAIRAGLASLSVLAGRLQDAQALAETFRPFVAYLQPRTHIIGRFEVVDVRVNKSDYDAAQDALARFAAVPPNQEGKSRVVIATCFLLLRRLHRTR